MSKLGSVVFVALLAGFGWASAAPVILGSYSFDSAAFGDTLTASLSQFNLQDNWLNTANADPGSPAYLTGANFDTGLRDIKRGFTQPNIFTIGYNAGIVNGPGLDLGIVVARGSADAIDIVFTTDKNQIGGGTILAASAHDTGVSKTYFTPTLGTFAAELYVHEIDLSSYGFAEGAILKSVTINEGRGVDLIRAAGLTPVPEPGTWALMAAGLAAVGFVARRRQR